MIVLLVLPFAAVVSVVTAATTGTRVAHHHRHSRPWEAHPDDRWTSGTSRRSTDKASTTTTSWTDPRISWLLPLCETWPTFVTTLRGGGDDDNNDDDETHRRDHTNDETEWMTPSFTTTLPRTTNSTAAAAALNDDTLVSNNNDVDDDDDGPIDETDMVPLEGLHPTVGVKQHSKKSNAVGDPDGEGSSDDEDDEELDELLAEWDESTSAREGADTSSPPTTPLESSVERVQVEVDYTMEDETVRDQTEDDAITDTETKQPPSNGGLRVRLGQHLKRKTARKPTTKSETAGGQRALQMERDLRAAWQSHVFLPPPTPGWTYLKEHARAMDTDGRTRLDRRTLYAALLLEWSTLPSNRKFLNHDVSQPLQASLSLATQPTWRQSLPRPSAMRLYDPSDPTLTGTTMAMQESVALALAHSMGVAIVILDDAVLASVRQQLLRDGYSEEDVKPAALIHSIMALARQGALHRLSSSDEISTETTASISNQMRSDLDAGLDDPFDERATSSYTDMVQWEKAWQGGEANTTLIRNTKESPLVIFLRTQAATSLLKSKAAVEVLLNECNSTVGRNLLILGKGIDATTPFLPKEPEPERPLSQAMSEQGMLAQNLQSAAPWFGFPPHNQNASGQNDPEGSRRFNIFLARTTDGSGTLGIVGAIAPPEAGNLFPHMMAMQARQQMDQNEDDEDSPSATELKRWTHLLQQQMQTNNGTPLPPPQFFNATISQSSDGDDTAPAQLTPEVIQQTLEFAMSELLDRLAQMNEDGTSSSDISPGLQKAFAQVLRNENLRRGISENLARAAPALSDPKCQGVLLSVFVPPPTFHSRAHETKEQKNQPHNMGNWFSKMLSHQDEADAKKDRSEEEKLSAMQKRVRTMAAAAAVRVAETPKEEQSKPEGKSVRNLAKLEAICRPIIVTTPSDPVRAKSWEGWIARERGAVVFRQNRKVLNEELEKHFLSLQERTGTRGAGTALRQMLSVRLLKDDMGEVIKRAIELEAAKSQRWDEASSEANLNETGLDVDVTLSQIVLTVDGLVATKDILGASAKKKDTDTAVQFIHPSSVEAALTSVCRISPSAAGWLAVPSDPVPHRSRDEISALAQDKHERALVSQVVSPQDIGVTYDMIGGLSEVKELLRQSITYPLKFPHLYSEGIAREAVKGVLLFGPPGTGKTMLAKAVATEGGASFLSVDASSVENKWLGESEKNAKAVFTLARRLAPCVIFIDEVDSLLSSREGSSDDSAHGTLTSVKTTMMSEWDGLNSGTNGADYSLSDRVVVIGSTNRPFDLDEAVLRRFPRRILVDLPDLKTRTEILEVTMAENRLDASVNLTKIAERLEGYTGSDIKECCREAVVQISHEQARMLDQGEALGASGREDLAEAGGSLQRLRSVTMDDFDKALGKLKRSVSEKGRELARVWEWNDEYGEIKRESKTSLPHLANMYL